MSSHQWRPTVDGLRATSVLDAVAARVRTLANDGRLAIHPG